MIFCFKTPLAFTFLTFPFLHIWFSYKPKSRALSASIILYALSLYNLRLSDLCLSNDFNSANVIEASLDSNL